MARRLSWSDVRGGVLAASVILVVAVATLRFSRLDTLHGDTFWLYARVAEARGVLVGSEVWLSGQKIGKVASISFLSPAVSDTSSRLELKMELLDKYRAAIHRDATAQIRPGGSIIGSPVVYLTPGTIGALVIRSGDTVNTHPQGDYEGAAGQFSLATKNFPAIINNIKVLAAELEGTRGTVGAFMNAPGGPGMPELSRTKREIDHLGAHLNGGGTVGRFMQGELTTRAQRVLARVDSVRALLASPNTSFGRYRRDSSLAGEIADIRNELTLVRRLVDEPAGTAGRALHDSAITNALGEAQRQMTLLFADIKKHPFRYLVF